MRTRGRIFGGGFDDSLGPHNLFLLSLRMEFSEVFSEDFCNMAGISFRPTPEAAEALAVLMARWVCRRSHAINRALVEMAKLEDPARQLTKKEPKTQDAAPVKTPSNESSTVKINPSKAREPVQASQQTETGGSVKHRQTIPKPDWKK